MSAWSCRQLGSCSSLRVIGALVQGRLPRQCVARARRCSPACRDRHHTLRSELPLQASAVHAGCTHASAPALADQVLVGLPCPNALHTAQSADVKQ